MTAARARKPLGEMTPAAAVIEARRYLAIQGLRRRIELREACATVADPPPGREAA